MQPILHAQGRFALVLKTKVPPSPAPGLLRLPASCFQEAHQQYEELANDYRVDS